MSGEEVEHHGDDARAALLDRTAELTTGGGEGRGAGGAGGRVRLPGVRCQRRRRASAAARGEVPAAPAGEVLAASAGEGRDHGTDEPYPIWLAPVRCFFFG